MASAKTINSRKHIDFAKDSIRCYSIRNGWEGSGSLNTTGGTRRIRLGSMIRKTKGKRPFCKPVVVHIRWEEYSAKQYVLDP